MRDKRRRLAVLLLVDFDRDNRHRLPDDMAFTADGYRRIAVVWSSRGHSNRRPAPNDSVRTAGISTRYGNWIMIAEKSLGSGSSIRDGRRHVYKEYAYMREDGPPVLIQAILFCALLFRIPCQKRRRAHPPPLSDSMFSKFDMDPS